MAPLAAAMSSLEQHPMKLALLNAQQCFIDLLNQKK
jgi:hypothetical protein